MKLKLLLFSFLTTSLLVFTSHTVISPKEALPKPLKDLKAVTYIPGGKIGDQSISGFYMFEEEVSNILYMELLYWLRDNNKKEDLQIAKIDTSLWLNIGANGNNLYAGSYHRKQNFPAVNISKEAAELYCKWLSDLWNNQQSEYTLTFRLPTKQEWQYAATGNGQIGSKKYTWNTDNCKNEKGVYIAQHKAFGMRFGPVLVDTFDPNVFGLYNMCGNVAEMVSEGVAMGGSWNDTENDIKISSEKSIKVSPEIGFRPVMTFVKR